MVFCKDYIHASDIARAIIDLVENQQEGTFNIGSGEAISTKSLLNMIYQNLESKFKVNDIMEEKKEIDEFS